MVNLAVVTYFGLFKRSGRVELYDLLRSRHASTASRWAASALGLNLR
jgi:hypothetical protein